MRHARRTAAIALATLVAGCSPALGETPSSPTPTPSVSVQPSPPPSASPSPSASVSPAPSRTQETSPSRSETRTSPSPEPSPSFPVQFGIRRSLLDGGAALAVKELHELSGLRPALKLDVSEDEVTLTVLTIEKKPQSYRWRDGTIDLAETDVQYLRQTTFWPTDFALDNVRRIFDVAALMGTSSNSQRLQVVEYSPGHVYMSVTTTPETSTIFFRKDATVFRSLDTRSVADIREGIESVTPDRSDVLSVGFDAQRGYVAEMQGPDNTVVRRSRMQNRPTFSSKRTGGSPLTPFDPRLIDASALAQTIALHDTSGKGCTVEIDNHFDRVQPVATYQCDGKTFRSDMRGIDLTDQLG
ncbi:MAG: hypothetical protein ABIS84_12290 [Arachnia sp.]